MSERQEHQDTGWRQQALARELAGSVPVEASAEIKEKEPKLVISVGLDTWTPDGKENEDRSGVNPDGSGVIADGVGSQENSIPAAKLTRSMIRTRLMSGPTKPAAFADAMNRRVEDTHIAIGKLAADKGQTMAAAASFIKPVTVGEESYVFVGSVGDAPAYLLRGGVLAELTDMHTNLPPNKDDRPALGKPNQPPLRAGWYKAQAGDVFVISSNGLRKSDPDMSQMKEILSAHGGAPGKAASNLVRMSPDRSRDSRTAIVVSYAEKAKVDKKDSGTSKRKKSKKK